MFDKQKIQGELDDVLLWLKKEYTSIRTGRAVSAILDSVKVESYGSLV